MTTQQASETPSLFVGVNEPGDPNNLSDLEKKHLPIIDAPDVVTLGECFDVTVEIGRLKSHPNEHGHFIQFVDLYADESFLARVDLASVKSCPKVTVAVSLQEMAEEIRAYGHCNLHGSWVGRRPLEVAV
jgi:superoxide reductase